MYLRHKLQRGLLTREQQPREDEMRAMSDYIAVLESFVDLEVSIIRSTKINKVLKAILKLESVPREDEFQFKKRSQSLLDKWNKLLAGDASGPPSATINGVNGAGEDSKSEANGARDVATESQVNEPDQAAPPKAEATAADEGRAHMLGSAEEKQDKPDAVAVSFGTEEARRWPRADVADRRLLPRRLPPQTEPGVIIWSYFPPPAGLFSSALGHGLTRLVFDFDVCDMSVATRSLRG